MNSSDSSNIDVIEGHSITEEAFENFGEESSQNRVLKTIDFLEKEINPMLIDQIEKNPRNECFDSCNEKGQNDETITEKKEKEIGEESSPGNVSLSSTLKTFVEEKVIDTKSIDQTEKNLENEIDEACNEKNNFICNSCNADDWFSCLCSETEDETKSPQDEKIVDQKLTKRKETEKEVEQKPRKYVCYFNDCNASFRYNHGLKLHIDSIHMNWRPFKCHECGSSFTQKPVLQGIS